MSNDWLDSSKRCDYCNGELLLLLPPYEAGTKKYCCKECADDAGVDNKNGKNG